MQTVRVDFTLMNEVRGQEFNRLQKSIYELEHVQILYRKKDEPFNIETLFIAI